MSQIKDLTGRVFSRLTVICWEGKTKSGNATWRCKCECGIERVVSSTNLLTGNTKSCGCLNIDSIKKLTTKHRHSLNYTLSPTYISWAHMKSRCLYQSDIQYDKYGGAGITVCERWLSFENFLADMGERPSKGYSIDRYPDINGNYEPGNCRWATRTEQSRNRKSNVWLTHDGKTMLLADWAQYFGVVDEAIQYHIKKGRTISQIASHYELKAKSGKSKICWASSD